jgi:hypothetical protein
LSLAIGGAVIFGAAGCPTVDLGEDLVEPGVCLPDPTYFRERIWPEYLAPPDAAKSCVMSSGCHSTQSGRSALRLETDPDDAAQMRNYNVTVRFLKCASPSESPLLTKPLAGIETHGGGDIFPNTMDPAVITFEDWFP